VTVSWTVLGSATAIVFQGSGEGVPMKLQDGSTSFAVPPTKQNYSINALFEFSQNGPSGPFSPSKVKDPIPQENDGFVQISVQSEDSSDNDYNDSVLMIAYMSLG
jgi:hypothetical protein